METIVRSDIKYLAEFLFLSNFLLTHILKHYYHTIRHMAPDLWEYFMSLKGRNQSQ